MSDSNKVQAAVEPKHHLIVAHEVTNAGSDRSQLYNMASQAKEALDVEALEVVADRDYFKGEEILACDQDNITTYLPKPQTSGSVKKGLYRKRDFIYHAEDDEYECPAGERLVWRFTTEREIAEVMRVEPARDVAVHIYRFFLTKGGQQVDYATIIELHHPDYLTREELRRLFPVATDAEVTIKQAQDLTGTKPHQLEPRRRLAQAEDCSNRLQLS